MEVSQRKRFGAYYTPDAVVRSLVSWAVASSSDRMLDPACGDGRFLAAHPFGTGVDGDPEACATARRRAPGRLVHHGDFFTWSANSQERFEFAAGNPPFIRYQRFTGETRHAAQRVCSRHGANFSSLSSSWAPFLVATASMLKNGGRMAFVVPAEIGHAPYAAPLLWYLLGNFSEVKIIALEEKLFPDLSEDCWILFCSGYRGEATSIAFTALRRFAPTNEPPPAQQDISEDELRRWGCRLRPFLISTSARRIYRRISRSSAARRLGDVARVGIGYVTGANDFFHLRPSDASRLSIPNRFFVPAVRNGRDLAHSSITPQIVNSWRRENKPNFLLRLRPRDSLPMSIQRYLESQDGVQARATYKCRNRKPWYAVPDVNVPDGFLSYMSGGSPALVANHAGCVATNSVHVVRMKAGIRFERLQMLWSDPLTQLSCEIEGHPLGGGLLKLEPREASNILVREGGPTGPKDAESLAEATITMRRWRHYG